MRKIIKNNYKIIIGIIIGLLISETSRFFINMKYVMKPKYEEYPEVKLREIKNNKTFAIMVESGDGYVEYSEDTWPGEEYIFTEAKCTDNNGTLVKEAVTFTDGKVTLTTNKTVYCTLYFDIKQNQIEYLRSKDTKGYLSEELQGGMYRYQAAPTNSEETFQMTNWICFGTKDNCGTNNDLIDKYMYRIIGITKEGQMYLLKETFLKEGDTIEFAWNTQNLISECLGETCEWSNSDLYKRLNGTVSNGNPIFVDNSYYEYMAKDNDWYNLIEDHNWIYGDTNGESSNIYNGNSMYGIETGGTATKRYWPDEETQTTCSGDSLCTEKPYTWSKSTDAAKIGLMYMHDIDYAYPGGNPENNTNVANSWIHFRKDGYNTSSDFEWLTTRSGVYNESYSFVFAWNVYYSGSFVRYMGVDGKYGARPVFYLSSNVKLKEGTDGTKVNPYILDV